MLNKIFALHKLFCLSLIIQCLSINAQPDNNFSFSGRMSIGACLTQLEHFSSAKWQQGIGIALTVEPYFKYRRKESFSIALGGGINFHQFSFNTNTAKYGIAYWGPKSELILHKYFINRKNSNTYFLGCGFGYAFHWYDQRLTNESGVIANAESLPGHLFFFSPQLGLFKLEKKNAFSVALQFTSFPRASYFLRTSMESSGIISTATYRGNYIGINIIHDWTINKNKKPKPIDKPALHPVPEIFAQRKTQVANEIKSRRKRITVWVYDHGTIDNDSISLQLNNEIVLSNYALVREKKKVKLRLEKGENKLILLAHNEGSNPPNSCAVIIRSGFRKQKLILNSTLQTNEGLLIRY